MGQVLEDEMASIDRMQSEEDDWRHAKVLGLPEHSQIAQSLFQRSQISGKHYLKQNKGIYYMAGRDCHYRPILVFDVKKVIDLEMEEEETMQAQIYFF